MKKFIVLLMLVSICSWSIAQDQLYKLTGEVENVKIVKASSTSIEYYYIGEENVIHQENKSNLIKIIYNNGREEFCTKVKQYPKINGKDDWEQVEVVMEISHIPNYLTQVRSLKATSGWGNDASELGIKSCIKDMQQQAAKLGCPVLLVTKINKGFSTSATGIAYKVNEDISNALISNNSKQNANISKTQNENQVIKNQTENYTSDIDIEIPVNSFSNDNYFALVIGNENYSNEIKVPFAINDATLFAEYLSKTIGIPAKQIHLLKDATYGQILGELEWIENILKVYKEDARVFIYYAGHGFPEESTKSTYILPIDGKSSTIATAIKLETIYTRFGSLNYGNITFFLDACFSGASREGMLTQGRGVKIKPKEDLLSGKMVVFSATSGDETAHPINEKSHGAFTYFLIKKIKETKGNVSYYDLFQYVNENVSKVSVIENRVQTPTVNTSEQLKDTWKELSLIK